MSGTKTNSSAEPARPTRIIHDVQVLIATQGTARDLTKHHIVSRSWHAAARREISLRLAGRGDASAALRGVEILEERVGPRPARGWRDTWAEPNYAKYLRIDPSVVPVREALLAHWRGRPLHGELAQVRASIDWKVQHGWSRTLAEAYTLIMTYFKGALGDSIREASREFSEAIHLLRDACSLRAPLEAVAPDAYTDLDGTYGMKTNDPVWGAGTGRRAGCFVHHARAPRGQRARPLPLGRGLRGRGGHRHGHRLRADGLGHRALPVARKSRRQAPVARAHRGDGIRAPVRPAPTFARDAAEH
jgi:hypothetical protein